METPNSTRGSIRTPTPRLSERKKSLFSSKEEAQEDLMNDIVPMESVKPILSDSNSSQAQGRRFIDCALNCREDLLKASSRRNMAFNSNTFVFLRNKMTPFPNEKVEYFNENLTSHVDAEKLEHLFNRSLMLSRKCLAKTHTHTLENEDVPIIDNSDDCDSTNKKRSVNTSMQLDNSPKRKVAKIENDRLLSTNIVSIPTKNFYSNSKTSTTANQFVSLFNVSHTSPKLRRNEQNRSKLIPINKGVSHKIRRRIKQCDMNRRYAHSSIDIDDIINNLRNEKLRNIITAKRQQHIQLDNIYQMLKCNQNSKPNQTNAEKYNKEEVSTSNDDFFEFSDIESEEDLVRNMDDHSTFVEMHSNVTDSAPACNTNRKFFKSGRSKSIRKEVKITENIRAALCDGKISLVEHKKHPGRKFRIKNSAGNEFSSAQATVDAILKNLDDSTFGETSTLFEEQINSSQIPQVQETSINRQNSIDDVKLQEDAHYSQFRNRLPYNTSDPELIEQQHLLLDFLINNNICTEENFTIFIADPENHKEDASRIVEQVIVVVNEQSVSKQINHYDTTNPDSMNGKIVENKICFKELYDDSAISLENLLPNRNEITEHKADNFIFQTTKNVVIEGNIELEISDQNKIPNHNIAQEIMERHISTEESHSSETNNLFPIFKAGKCRPLPQKSSRKSFRSWTGGQGANQYQIDAGQRNFGAQQCKQCGLLYSAHEPEEEKLHQDYHASLSVLRFKGWIDEDIVAFYPEWGVDGRIIKISDNSHTRRKERLMEVLNIVDKELGFSSYIFPKSFVAYVAVRKYQIVGLCLVEPLNKASKYFSMNGVDYCTDEEFEAKCGISRLWVSPLHRRLHIASKLIQAAQFNTILGEQIPLDKLAFSAPTENGKEFARKVTKMENFLVYF